MGSLPNLHELEEAERKREKRREYEFLLEQQRRRRLENHREHQHLSLFEKHRKQSAYNDYLVNAAAYRGHGLRRNAGGNTGINLTAAAAAATSVAAVATASAAAAAVLSAGVNAIEGGYCKIINENNSGIANGKVCGGGFNTKTPAICGSVGGNGGGPITAANNKKSMTTTATTTAVLSGNFAISGAGRIGGSGGTTIIGLTGHSTLLTTTTIGGVAGPSTTKNQKQQQNHLQQQQQQQQQQHHHFHHHYPHLQRHSLTTRHRIQRARSSGAAHNNIWDDQMLDHLAACSPISTRSHRINPVSSYQVQAALAASRRRESINSSIGATSIRRLITLNNRNCRNKVPLQVRQRVGKNFTCLTIAHGLMCAIILPLAALQSSNSVWHHRELWLHIGPNIGSLLFSLGFLIASGVCFWSSRLIKRFGYTMPIALNYLAMLIFLLCHLYPSIYTLLPAYIILGLTLSPARVSKIALIVHLGSKLSCSQHECALTESQQDEHRLFCNRDQKIRRLARWFHVAQDIGIILGALVAALTISCASSDWNCSKNGGNDVTITTTVKSVPTTTMTTTTPASSIFVANNTYTQASISNGTDEESGTKAAEYEPQPHSEALYMQHWWPYLTGYLDNFYSHNEHDERICGAEMCPIWRNGLSSRELRMAKEFLATDVGEAAALTTTTSMPFNFLSNRNVSVSPSSAPPSPPPAAKATAAPSIYEHFINSTAQAGGTTLISVYIIFAIGTLGLSAAIGKINATFRNDRIKGFTDTLLFAGPMAYFIGTEQAYMLGDFMRAFVSCTLGLSMVGGALIAMGIMQSIVSCTLSMLLRHTKRILVILAGFFFHSCLLLTLSSWKPSSDDSALFYVIAASWGACNGMWETLQLTLVTLNHTNHVAEVTAPLQALRYLGLGITFGVHGYLCETTKIIALVVMLVVSVPPYAMLEIRLETQRKATLNSL